jgi:hypothetical protein
MFNEGIDVPAVDRVVMLRPTESPVVFLQQLGRGLRSAPDQEKQRLTVIDFVGNHRMFLERVRRLLSLGSAGEHAHIATLLDAPGPVELPTGCSVDVELEAKDLLLRLLPRGGREVERIYRELRAGRDERPRAGERKRMGYLPSTLRQAGQSWFDFVRAEGDLGDDELRALLYFGETRSEGGSMSGFRSFKFARNAVPSYRCAFTAVLSTRPCAAPRSPRRPRRDTLSARAGAERQRIPLGMDRWRTL